MHTPLLVIGYGNTLRSDDGVGPKIAQAVADLALPGVEVIQAGLLAPELAAPISRAASVVFVDAAVDAREVNLREVIPAKSSQVLAHAADPKTVLALARDVFGHVPKAWLLSIPVESMGIGEDLSPLAQKGSSTAIEHIKHLAQRAAGIGGT